MNAYSKEQMPGNIPAEIPGVNIHYGPDTTHIIYIEMKGKAETIVWDSAWKDAVSYSISATQLTEKNVEAGNEKGNGNKIILSPAAGNQLWELYLYKSDKNNKAPADTKKGEILLRGRSGLNVILKHISSEIELESLPSV